MKIKSAMAALLALFILSGAALGATVKVKGIPSCEQWSKERQDNQFRGSGMWLIGWLSGWAAATSKDFWSGENSAVLESETVFRWMDDYCRAHPLEDVADGGVKMFVERVRAAPESTAAAGAAQSKAAALENGAPAPQSKTLAAESKAPKLAMVVFSKEPGFVAATRNGLGKCLVERGVFSLADAKAVDSALAKGKYDLDRVYGLDDAEYRAIAAQAGSEYVLFGNLAIVKALKFTGWRKDIYSMFYLHHGATGKKMDSWRSDTILDFTDAASELDAGKMLAMVVDRACAKIAQDFHPG